MENDQIAKPRLASAFTYREQVLSAPKPFRNQAWQSQVVVWEIGRGLCRSAKKFPSATFLLKQDSVDLVLLQV